MTKSSPEDGFLKHCIKTNLHNGLSILLRTSESQQCVPLIYQGLPQWLTMRSQVHFLTLSQF